MKTLSTLVVVALLAFGGYWYFNHQAEVKTFINNMETAKNNAVATTTTDADNFIKTTIQGVNTLSPLYYFQNRNYGVSATQNICNDTTSKGSLGGIISTIQTYTKAVSCVVNPTFPSTTFTIIAPSLANSGEYYCTDQSGFSVLTSEDTFETGVKCK